MELIKKNGLTKHIANSNMGNMDTFEFLGRLRRAIKEAGISQVDLAAELDCSQGHLSNILGGVKPLYLDKLLQIAELINFDMSFLLSAKVREEIEFDMSTTHYPDLVRRIINKIVQMDSSGKDALIRMDAYADGVLSDLSSAKKKIA